MRSFFANEASRSFSDVPELLCCCMTNLLGDPNMPAFDVQFTSEHDIKKKVPESQKGPLLKTKRDQCFKEMERGQHAAWGYKEKEAAS